MPLDSVPHYQDYISRLQQIPRVLEQTIEVMRQGMKDGLMPPTLVLEKLPGQCDGIIAANPFLSFFTVAKESGTITLAWTGDDGQTQTETATITVE